MNKRGQELGSVIAEVVIGIAVAGAILFLIFLLYSSNVGEEDKIAKSYFEVLERELEIVDDSGSGEFVMLERGGDVEFYLIYFGSVAEFDEGWKHFSASKVGENILCVCYAREESKFVSCKNCLNLDVSFSYEGNKNNMQVLGEGERFRILKDGGGYEFVKG